MLYNLLWIRTKNFLWVLKSENMIRPTISLRPAFTPTIFAAIFTAILAAISNRPCKLAAIWLQFCSDIHFILLSSGLKRGKPMEGKERRDKFPLRGPQRQRFGNFPCKNRREIATKFEQVRNSGDFSAIWIFKSPRNRHKIAASLHAAKSPLKSPKKSPV